jgi:hypothetical protein
MTRCSTLSSRVTRVKTVQTRSIVSGSTRVGSSQLQSNHYSKASICRATARTLGQLGRLLFRSRWGWRVPDDRRHDSGTAGGSSGRTGRCNLAQRRLRLGESAAHHRALSHALDPFNTQCATELSDHFNIPGCSGVLSASSSITLSHISFRDLDGDAGAGFGRSPSAAWELVIEEIKTGASSRAGSGVG